MKLCKSGELLK